MFRERGRIAQEDELHAGAGDGDIHPSQVGKKPNLSGLVRADQADEDDVSLLSLEAIDGVYREERTNGFEEWSPFQ